MNTVLDVASAREVSAALPAIPVIATGPSFALETLTADPARAHELFDAATRLAPRPALRMLDAISRRWLAKWDNAHLNEIDGIARALGRPGVYFLSVQYEWACTCAVRPSADGRSAQLVRVLDWRVGGLGRHVMAARVAGPAGRYVTLTWPGFTGVIQGVAPGRFAAAMNQAPMRQQFGRPVLPLDWVAARARLWQSPHPTAAHTLRKVFDEAATYAEAREMLSSLPIAAPAIYILAGIEPHETCIIERTETGSRIRDGRGVAANHWSASGGDRGPWPGRARGIDSIGRERLLEGLGALEPRDFSWARYPVLNPQTRLIMVADARTGHLVAQGYEASAPATQVLDLAA